MMDTSKESIKMCEMAKEIQKLADRYIDKWSFFYCKEHNRLNQWSIDDEAYYCLGWKQLHKLTIQSHRLNFQRLSSNSIWLPRQDQLQAMIIKDVYLLSEAFDDFVGDEEYPFTDFKSMEQLWLAFVMKEKFNKYYDGKDWVKFR